MFYLKLYKSEHKTRNIINSRQTLEYVRAKFPEITFNVYQIQNIRSLENTSFFDNKEKGMTNPESVNQNKTNPFEKLLEKCPSMILNR